MGKKEDGKVIFGKLVSPKCTQIPQFTKLFELKCFTPFSSHIKGTFALVNRSHMQIAKPNPIFQKIVKLSLLIIAYIHPCK
jgi:hypothetical protein